MMVRRVGATLLALVPLAGCADDPAAAPDRRVLPGVISWHDQPIVVDVPDTVTVGQTFTASITTWGSSGCTEFSETATTQLGQLLIARPYDLVTIDTACPAELVPIVHSVELAFDFAARATVLFVGTRVPERTETDVQRTVTVRFPAVPRPALAAASASPFRITSD